MNAILQPVGSSSSPNATSPLFRLTSLILLLAVLLPVSAWSDQLRMDNGDIISGTLKDVTDEKVTIEPSYGDPITVNLGAVTSITTDGEFDIKLADGTEVEIQLNGTSNGQLELVVDGETQTVPLAELQFAAEPEPHFERVSHADLNMTLNSGNTDSQNVLIYADTRLRFGDHRHLGALTFRRDETDGISSKEQDLFTYEYNWLFTGHWYLGVNASYERDPIRDLDHRYILGASLGRDIFNDDNRFLSISLGAGYSDEEIAKSLDSGSVGMWKLNYEQKLLATKMAFFHYHTLNQQFYGNDNLIFKSNTGFRYDIFADIYANVAFRYDYETEPAAGASKDDTTLVVGIGAKF